MEKLNNTMKFSETFGDAIKLAANLSESVKDKKDISSYPDNNSISSTNPNQQVQIHIGENDSKKKEEPVIIHEKPETHIHKDFPDDRSMTDKECDLALEKAKMENNLKIEQLKFEQYKYDIERMDRLDREEKKRKDDIERRKRDEKKAKIRGIIGGVLAVLGAGYFGYSVYRGNRYYRTGAMDPQKTDSPVISTEGTVQ